MKKRILGGAIIAAILIPILLLGGIYLYVGVGLLGTIAYKELIDVKKDNRIPALMKIVGLVCMLLLTYVNVGEKTLLFGLNYTTLSLIFLLMLAPTVLLHKYNYSVKDAFYLASITIFLGTVFNLFIMQYDSSFANFVYLLIIAMATDIFALFGGMLIGKHKLTEISPKKTIEGSIVGSTIAVIIGTTYFMIMNPDANLVSVIFITLGLSIIGQIGDLFFSLIKRENDVKDYSNLIPGHGGVLDRIDSVIFILITYVVLSKFL